MDDAVIGRIEQLLFENFDSPAYMSAMRNLALQIRMNELDSSSIQQPEQLVESLRKGLNLIVCKATDGSSTISNSWTVSVKVTKATFSEFKGTFQQIHKEVFDQLSGLSQVNLLILIIRRDLSR